jgi:succinate dehydrogenase / fumarate reductase cytochrome b subunit
MWAWALHRLSGLALALYLIVHILVISSSAVGEGGLNFDRLLAQLQQPFWIAVDLLLWAAVLFHMLNGIRILLFDAGLGVRSHKAVFWGFMAVGVIAWALGAYALLPFVLGKPLF